MRGNCFYGTTITGKKSELEDGVNQILKYLVKLKEEPALKITEEEVTEIQEVLRKIKSSDKNSVNLNVGFSLGHPYEFCASDIGYKESLFPAAKLMPTAEMSANSEWEGPGDIHKFNLHLKDGKITVSTYDWDADWGEGVEEEYTYTLVDGDWVHN